MDKISFLKPTFIKFAILVIFILITIPIPKYENNCSIEVGQCYKIKVPGIGYPVFYGEKINGYTIENKLSPELLLLNIVIFYLLSCSVIYLYEKNVKRN
jgi:hypothetical protein